MQFILFLCKKSFQLMAEAKKKEKSFTFFPCCFGFSLFPFHYHGHLITPRTCVFPLRLPPPSVCCILSGFPLPFVFCFSPTSGPTDPYVLVLISFPDWTHFLSWPYFSWPSPSFLYTCPELFSCQTRNTVIVLWKSLKKAKHWKMQKMVVLYAVLLCAYTASGDPSMGASEDRIRYWVACIPKTLLSVKGQMQNFSKFV